MSYTPDLRDKAKTICDPFSRVRALPSADPQADRLDKLSQHELEASSKAFIIELGAKPVVVLSDVQEQILQIIERSY